MLEGVVTSGHFDVVVIELVAFWGEDFFVVPSLEPV